MSDKWNILYKTNCSIIYNYINNVMIYIQVFPRDQCWAWVPWMMAVTDIIGFSFFIILAVLIFLFSLVTFTFSFFFFLSSFLSPPPPPSSTTLHRIRKILLSSETRTISLSRHLEKRKKRLADHHHHHLLLLLHLSLLLLLLLLLPSLNRANFPSSFGIDLVSFNALLFGCFAFERSTLDRSTIRNKNGIYCIGF